MISAKIIADSVSVVGGKRIITMELEYPRFIHSELMTHRLFSRNAASSRAIPITKMIEMASEAPAKPVHWGKNQSGMSAKEELKDRALELTEAAWDMAADDACHWAEIMSRAGAHKQIANRVLEPFQWMKTVVTSTEWDNFFWLRAHEDAQPEIQVLALRMREAMEASEPVYLVTGAWHTPYYEEGYWIPSDDVPTQDRLGATLENALAISASCCAQVSYRKLDDTLEKALTVYERLVGSAPVHASPFEHQATPMEAPVYNAGMTAGFEWEDGVTHMMADGRFGSGNFLGWIQNRQLIPNNAVWSTI